MAQLDQESIATWCVTGQGKRVADGLRTSAPTLVGSCDFYEARLESASLLLLMVVVVPRFPSLPVPQVVF